MSLEDQNTEAPKKLRADSREVVDSLPEGPPEDERFILSTYYARKHGFHWNVVAKACLKGILISQRRRIYEKRGGYRGTAAAWYGRWFVLDVPPEEHPKWEEYNTRKIKNLAGRGKRWYKDFGKWAPTLLERFDEARKDIDHTRYSIKELSKMLRTDPSVIRSWSVVGIEGFGKLPKILLTEDKKPLYIDGKYAVHKGVSEFWYETKDIRRFLKKELADPKVKFNTLDDKLGDTNIDEIAEEFGYFRYDPSRVYPMTYDGFLKWLDENVLIYDKETNRPVKINPNEKQHELYKNTFELNKKGFLKHKLISLSRPRGEYKTTDVCLIVLFFFFNRPKQVIYLIACNSAFQSEELLMKEIKGIIKVSPKLRDNIWLEMLEGEINILGGKKDTFNSIKTASIKSGTLSNATLFVFTEFFELQDRRDFAKLENSTRVTPNAFSIIEGVATDENHLFCEIYKAYMDGKDPLLYFQWYGDEWYNPRNTPEEREHFLVTAGEVEHAKHFRNIWGGTSATLFERERLLEIGAYGVDNIIGSSPELTAAINELAQIEKKILKLDGATDITNLRKQRLEIRSRLKYMDDLYKLPATFDDIETITKVFGFDYYSIGIGVDRAKQMSRRSDRTAVVTVLKAPIDEYRWLCFILDIFLPDDATLDAIVGRIDHIADTFGFVSNIDLEEYLNRDVYDKLIAKGYNTKLVPQSFKHQDEIVPILYNLVNTGLFKCPTVPLWFDETSKVYHSLPPGNTPDILRAELEAFIGIEKIIDGGVARKAGYYGSKHKMGINRRVKPGEANDDVAIALCHAVHAIREDDGMAYIREANFAMAEINKQTIGVYP